MPLFLPCRHMCWSFASSMLQQPSFLSSMWSLAIGQRAPAWHYCWSGDAWELRFILNVDIHLYNNAAMLCSVICNHNSMLIIVPCLYHGAWTCRVLHLAWTVLELTDLLLVDHLCASFGSLNATHSFHGAVHALLHGHITASPA